MFEHFLRNVMNERQFLQNLRGRRANLGPHLSRRLQVQLVEKDFRELLR